MGKPTHRRELWPIPIEGLIRHPEYRQMSAGARGMTVSLVFYYWETHCAPLPSKGELYCVCRPNRAVWARHFATMMRVFNDIRPELDAYYRFRSERKSIIQAVGAKAVARKRLERLEKNAAPRPEVFDASPARERERSERVATPEERGPRARVLPTARNR